MIILFDELGAYAENWCHNKIAAGGLAPQQILEACNDRPGRVCLVAFIQRQLDQFVARYSAEEDFKKWAERFPPQTRYKLETSLEQVIQKLLMKKPAWEEFARSSAPKIERVCDATWKMLSTYQSKPDIWNQGKFTNIVGLGTFPLHPLTTGLLCNIDFVQSSRTIISFVDEAVREIEGDPVTKSSNLNWILPTVLVDKFKDSFEGQQSLYLFYDIANKKLGSNAESSFYLVLKALFLFLVGNLKRYPSQSHANVLSQLCGLTETEVEGALKKLVEDHAVIFYSKAKQEYEFAGIGTSPHEIRQQLQPAIAGKSINSLADNLTKLKLLESIELPPSEANSFKTEHAVEGDEWRLEPHLIDAAKLDADYIRRIFNEIATRGLVLYVVAKESTELDKAQETAQNILNSLKHREYNYPVVIAIPYMPASDLEKEILMREALESWGEAKREQYGEGYQQAIKRSDKNIKDSLKAHLGSIRYVVSSRVEQRLKGGEMSRPDLIANRLFEEAFPYRAPSKFHTMRLISNKGNSSVAQIARSLIVNNLDSDFNVLDKATQDLITHVLVEGKSQWGILNTKRRLQEPKNEWVLGAWHELDNTIHEEKPVNFASLSRDLRFLPYGYDDFTLTLLYAAWIGKNRNDLSFTGVLDVKKNSVRTLLISDIQGQLNKAKDFIKWLKDGNVQVRRPGLKQRREAKKYLQQLQDVLNYEKAKELLAKLEVVKSGISNDEDVAAQINTTAAQLASKVKEIDDYQRKVQEYRKKAEKVENVALLLEFLRTFPQQPSVSLEFDEDFFVETKRFIEERIDSLVEKRVQQPLKEIENYNAMRRDIESLKEVLQKSGREDLKQKCVFALEQVDIKYNTLKSLQEEKQFTAGINAIQVDNLSLKFCRESAEHINELLNKELTNSSEKTRHQVEKKLKLISNRVADYEIWLNNLLEQISHLSDLTNAQKLRDEIIVRERDYADTPEAESLEQNKQLLEEKTQALEKAAEAKQRQARNQNRVTAALKQTAGVQTLREIHNALTNLIDVRSRLESPCDEDMAKLEAESRRLEDSSIAIRSFVNEALPTAISAVWTGKEINDLRQKVVSYEALCAGDELLSATLGKARLLLDDRLYLIKQLSSLEQQATAIEQCQGIIEQLKALKSEHQDNIAPIEAAESRLQKRLVHFQAEEHRKAEEWLSQFQIAINESISPEQANQLLHKLEEKPAGLKDSEQFISSVRQRLNEICDADLVGKITNDFTKLQTSEQRAECLLRIAEICKAQEISPQYTRKLIELLESQRAL